MIFPAWAGRSVNRGPPIAAALRPSRRLLPAGLEAINHPLETAGNARRRFTRFWSLPSQTASQQTPSVMEGGVAQQMALLIEEIAGDEPAIDISYLARMTFGDRSLERGLLELFDRQASLLLPRMRASDAPAATLAHTLKGSACGIGACNVTRAARPTELAAGGAAAECSAAIDRLAAAIEEARALIAELLRAQ